MRVMSTGSEDTPRRMGKCKKGDRPDASRFQSPGINYKGKLIGVEDVPGPRGDKMCQVAMAKVKAAVKTIGEHKLKIIANISLDGVRIVEEKSENIIYFHPVQRISFISRDPGDSRAFGYVYGREDGSHQFYGIKTEKVAENIVLNLRDLFQIVYEMKKQEKEDLKEPFVTESASTSSVRKICSSKNGLEQLNVYSSSMTLQSPGREILSKFDSPGNPVTCGSSFQSPVSQDRKVFGVSHSGYQRGFLAHHVSEQPVLAVKQYSSLTSSKRHQLHSKQDDSPVISHHLSTSEAVMATVSPTAKVQSQHSSPQVLGWFPVALPPPEATSTTGRRTVLQPHNGLGSCPTSSSSACSEGWAVFGEEHHLSSSSGSYFVIEEGKEDGFQGDKVTETEIITSEQLPQCLTQDAHPEEVHVLMEGKMEKFLKGSGATYDVEIEKQTSGKLSCVMSSSSASVSDSPAIVSSCTFYSHVDGSAVSPKFPSAVPKLASPESLSDEETESFPDASSFPSPDTPPPPLPLNTVVEFPQQAPVVPPRPKTFELAMARLVAESAESPIYGNLPISEVPVKNSFTLPRPTHTQADARRAVIKAKPKHVGYDLAMPGPEPVRNSAGCQPCDDLTLSKNRALARPPLLRGKTLSSCQHLELNDFVNRNSEAASQCSDAGETKLKIVSSNNLTTVNDPFAICIVSKLSKPQTFVTRSAVASDGLIHTSISPIPRPRPRQRSAPGSSRDPSTISNLTNSESPSTKRATRNLSPLETNFSVDTKHLHMKQSNLNGSETNKSNHSTKSQVLTHRKPEPLSCDKVGEAPERLHNWSTGSNRSDTAPDPFIQVDPFAAESFSEDPFSSQPDPLSFESPSDPFSKEFPKKTSKFCTRAVTVELGDVFEDAGLADQDQPDHFFSSETDKKVSSDSGSGKPHSLQHLHTQTEFGQISGGHSETVCKELVDAAAWESAFEQKFLENSGDSLTVASTRKSAATSLNTEQQLTPKCCQGLRKGNPLACGGSGDSFWRNFEENDELAVLPKGETIATFSSMQTENHPMFSSLPVLLKEQAPNSAKSERENFKVCNVSDVTSNIGFAEGFSDSFNPVPGHLLPNAAEPSQSQNHS